MTIYDNTFLGDPSLVKPACGYAAIGLINPKTKENVGGVLRAAGCYGAAQVVTAGKRFGRCITDTMAAYRHMPFVRLHDAQRLWDAIPYDCVPVGVELVGYSRNLVSYTHPERAFYIFGPEDGSVPREILSKCRDVVAIPTNACMNLAATVNVVLYDRLAKQAARRKA